MELKITDEVEMKKWMLEKIESGKWWTILVTNEPSGRLIECIENKYYFDNETGPGFEVAVTSPLGFGCFAIAFALKKHMKADQFNELINRFGDLKKATSTTADDEHDIIVIDAGSDVLPAMLFHNWLTSKEEEPHGR